MKPGVHDLVSQLPDTRGPLGVSDDQTWWYMPASALPATVDHELEPKAIVILHRSPDGALDVERALSVIHPTDAVVALMGQTMDAQRFGPDAVSVLAHLAARCHCVALAVGPLDSSTSALEGVIASAPESWTVHELVRPTDFELRGWTVANDARSFMIGDRVVVHDTAGGVIVALDEAGAAMWLALHGDSPAWWHEETMSAPGALPFLEALSSNGLVVQVGAREQTRA